MHTKEPWRHEGPDQFGDFNILHDGDSLAVAAVVSNMRPPAEVEANALRIVAAINACAGIEQRGLSAMGETNILALAIETNHTLKPQRDELLAALEAMVGKATKQNWNDLYPEILEQAFAAISKARGEA